MPGFTVDTHVFRELGELLVGRDSTALIELIKNSYDADATDVVVFGENLGDLEQGLIVVADNGIGMDARVFAEGFLRIASRTKDIGDRRSTRFNRRYTGAKGIGRLAAHKLARLLEVESLTATNGSAVDGVVAKIDWDRIEQQETLDQVAGTDAITVDEVHPTNAKETGTKISLRRLRRRWTQIEHGRFLEEIQSFAPPRPLIEPLPPAVVAHPLLFHTPTLRDAGEEAAFIVRLEGDLAPPDDYWAAAVAAANWIIEIDASSKPGRVAYCIAPTRRTLEDVGGVETRRFRMAHPGGPSGPLFQARILLRTGLMAGGESVRAWSGRAHGIRVFMEGFRVLPYGEPRNDWLGLDRDYAERSSDFLGKDIAKALLPALPPSADDRPGLLHLPNKNYFGGVFLTQQGAPSLRLLVNREGFVPDTPYEQLVRIVRIGLDLTTRVRATVTASQREHRRVIRGHHEPSAGTPEPPSFIEALGSAAAHAGAARRLTAAGNTTAATRELDVALGHIRQVTDASDELADQAAMLRVLASVGTQLSSFVHEMNGLLSMSATIEATLLRTIDGATELKRSSRARLREVAKSLSDLRRHIERHASYLIDVVTPDARRRRSRQRLASRFQAAIRLVQTAADRRGIEIINAIPEELKSPPTELGSDTGPCEATSRRFVRTSARTLGASGTQPTSASS
jgi:hypothetical protein